MSAWDRPSLCVWFERIIMVVDVPAVSPVPRHAEVCYKAVAVHASRMLSIFDGVTEYRLDEVTHMTSGLWACPSLAAL